MRSTVTGIDGGGSLGAGQFGDGGQTFGPGGQVAGAFSASRATPPSCPDHLRISPAGPGDHPSIQYLLTCIFHGPSSAEFQAQLEDPYYEPTDRLVAKRGERVVAHLRLSNREMFFGPAMLPITTVTDVATLPEYQNLGCATALLEAADQKMVDEGAAMAILRTSIPQFYARRGWSVCGRHCFSTARPRDILSYLSATQSARDSRVGANIPHLLNVDVVPRELNIRLWRHVERAALMRLYAANTVGSYGAIRRSEPYWRWLISRRGYDRIYVAIDGPDRFELDDLLSPIVGYAAMREGRIVEMMVSPRHPTVASSLLARACGDAIERDYHTIRFDGAPNDPLHRVIELAGGKHYHHEAENGEVFMVKVYQPLRFLQSLCPQMHERAKAAGLARPSEMGLLVDGERHRIVLNPRSVKLESGKLARSYMTCTRSQLVQLMCGHVNVQDAAESSRLDISTRVGVDIASVLFPNLPFWRPPFDELSS